MARRGEKPLVADRRQKEARRKILHKVRVLQEWAQDGVPEGVAPPRSEEQFRVWEDPERGLEKIGSKSTLNRPENLDLKEEANRLVAALRDGHRRGERRGEARRTQLDRLREEIRELRLQVSRLASQYSSERDKALRAQAKLASADRRIDELMNDRSDLIQQVSELRTIPRIIL